MLAGRPKSKSDAKGERKGEAKTQVKQEPNTRDQNAAPAPAAAANEPEQSDTVYYYQKIKSVPNRWTFSSLASSGDCDCVPSCVCLVSYTFHANTF